MSIVEEKFSKKFEEAVSDPKHRGAWDLEDAAKKGQALVQAKHKDTKLCWLVHEDRIYSARFFAYGGKVSLAIGETLCSMVEGLTLQEACSLTDGDVERKLRDDPETASVPQDKMSAFKAVSVLLKIIEEEYPSAKAMAQASAAAKEGQNAIAPSLDELTLVEQAWLGLSEEEQIAQVDLVLDEKVRQALMNDGGNVEVVNIIEGRQVIIQYQGACGNCGSSIGATLSFIEQALRTEIYKDLTVIPNTYI